MVKKEVNKSYVFALLKIARYFDKTMVVQQTFKTVYLAVVILQETKLGINKSGAFVHLKVCNNKKASGQPVLSYV